MPSGQNSFTGRRWWNLILRARPFIIVIASWASPAGSVRTAHGEFSFALRQSDYESVTNTITVTADQTNSFHTKLVSRFYTQANAPASYTLPKNLIWRQKRQQKRSNISPMTWMPNGATRCQWSGAAVIG